MVFSGWRALSGEVSGRALGLRVDTTAEQSLEENTQRTGLKTELLGASLFKG